jgi:UrcA family protein
MYTKTAFAKAWSAVGATIVACTFCAGEVVAQEHDVTVAYRVSTQGLDLNTSAGARELYVRLKNAAWFVCTRTNRIGLQDLPDPDACSEKTLGETVRSTHLPLLVQVYLETHTLGQAAAHGIDVSSQLAAK